MLGFSRITICGNACRDAVLKPIGGGRDVLEWDMAVNRDFHRPDGTVNNEVLYLQCRMFGPAAVRAHKWITKGRSLLVDGVLRCDTWQNNAGQKRTKFWISATQWVLMHGDARHNPEPPPDEYRTQETYQPENDTPADADIPF